MLEFGAFLSGQLPMEPLSFQAFVKEGMKKILVTIVMLCGVWISAHSLQINSATAQSGTIATTIIPLTNQVPFTNTLVPPTNLTTIQLSNVLTLLLTLQTNIEETLPVLDLLQSNAIVVSVVPTNRPFGIVPPLTNPASSRLTPTGAATGNSRPLTSLAVRIGTNEFAIDAPTLQGLFVLRDDLQRSLTVLQQLNGTTPPPTNSAPALPPPSSFIPPPVTNFSPGPMTNGFTVPMTNTPPFVTSGVPSAF
jgi:hypothetical protein